MVCHSEALHMAAPVAMGGRKGTLAAPCVAEAARRSAMGARGMRLVAEIAIPPLASGASAVVFPRLGLLLIFRPARILPLPV